MASIHRSIPIHVPAQQVWAALEDVGALHTRLVPGFVTDCTLEGDVRQVSFANGMQVSERIIDVDPQRMRVVWSAAGGRLSHHNASAQVVPTGEHHCEVIWVADLLPHAMAPAIASLIEQGLAAMKRCQESASTA